MGFVIGVDGGGTKTLSALWDEEGNLLSWSKEGPSNPLFIGWDEAKRALVEAVKRVASLLPPSSTGTIITGGGGTPSAREEISNLFPNWKIMEMGDVETALRAALPRDKEGVVVRAGTGSFAVAQDCQGNKKIIDGLGPLLGDEGSATDIGLMALRAVGRHFMGKVNCPHLAKKVLESFSVSSLGELIHRLHTENVKRHQISSLAKLVWECREEKICREILREAGRRLANSALRAASYLKLQTPIFLVGGGVFKARDVFLSFKRAVRKTYPSSQVDYSPLEPLAGAFIIAKGGDVSPQLKEKLKEVNKLYL
jgi:N-acetylglucosamine kinase-like BadF-type ATPase